MCIDIYICSELRHFIFVFKFWFFGRRKKRRSIKMASLRPVLNKQHSSGGSHRRNSSNSTSANNHAAFGNNKFRVRTFRASTAPSSSQCDPNNGGGSSKKTPSSNVSTTAAVTTNLTEIKLVKYPFMQVWNETLFTYLCIKRY